MYQITKGVQIKVKNSRTDTINGSKIMRRMVMVILTVAGTVIALLR